MFLLLISTTFLRGFRGRGCPVDTSAEGRSADRAGRRDSPLTSEFGYPNSVLAKTTPPINPTVLFIVPHGCLCPLPVEKQHVHNRPFSYSNGLSSKRFLHAYIPQDGHIDRFRQGKNRR